MGRDRNREVTQRRYGRENIHLASANSSQATKSDPKITLVYCASQTGR